MTLLALKVVSAPLAAEPLSVSGIYPHLTVSTAALDETLLGRAPFGLPANKHVVKLLDQTLKYTRDFSSPDYEVAQAKARVLPFTTFTGILGV